MKQYPVAKEGWPFLAILAAVSVVTYEMFYMWAILPTILLLFTGYFFRNPYRAVPVTENTIVSPADGVITSIEEQYEDLYMEEDAIKISIFLSLFNVHINRSPCEGTVDFIQRVSGKFVMANRKEAGAVNSRNYLGLRTPWGKVLVVQITGFIARRIVCWAEEGDLLNKGQRFGLIRFGSCTEVFLPRNIMLEVKSGDKVKGGVTILGRFTE
ncbi:MAG: phosphatidylserine decarboxylase family protein [Syntrophomonadaceae bacterium]|jgi:phosphatidylserine decarboxylase|nr:phosphatidylserine decarboxylase family protein [Syntrophomonadaceae bacterium]